MIQEMRLPNMDLAGVPARTTKAMRLSKFLSVLLNTALYSSSF